MVLQAVVLAQGKGEEWNGVQERTSQGYRSSHGSEKRSVKYY